MHAIRRGVRHSHLGAHPAGAVGQNHPRTPWKGKPEPAEETVTDIQKEGRPDRFSVELNVVGGVRVVTVRGEIDHPVKDVLGEALLREDGTVPPPPRIVADLSGVTFLDSSGINVFIAVHRQVSEAQGWLRIAGAQKSVLRVLTLVGVDTFIPCHPTIEHALNT